MRPLLLLVLFVGGGYVAATSTTSTTAVNLRTQATIEGDETQIVTVRLKPGQTIRARSNMMLYMTRGIRMVTAMYKGASKRFLTGDPLFLIDYTNMEPEKDETVTLGSKLPSKIISLNLDEHGGTLNIRKNSLLVCNVDLETSIHSPKGLRAKVFGAQGFFLQGIHGRGDVLLRAGGVLITKQLEPGETLRIAPRSLLAYTSTVQYGVESCSSFSNVMFGDESLFVTTLEGPGTVWMQGMSPQFYIRKETRISSSSRRSSSSPSTSSSTSRRDARQTGLGVRSATPFQSTILNR
jgi:uncharacterized protein (AIM24 family)